jgi:hypothetical protein
MGAASYESILHQADSLSREEKLRLIRELAMRKSMSTVNVLHGMAETAFRADSGPGYLSADLFHGAASTVLSCGRALFRRNRTT